MFNAVIQNIIFANIITLFERKTIKLTHFIATPVIQN